MTTPRLGRLGGFYVKTAGVAVSKEFQYRATNYFLLATMVFEALLYLLLWQAVARVAGGSVGGWTIHTLAAYFIVWTLVRNMTTATTPHDFEERIRDGTFTGALLRPIHPIHRDLAEYAGWKLVMVVLWVPVAVGLALIFRPALSVTPLEAVVFVVAIWAAYLLRSLYLWLLGLTSFWTTRAGAAFDLILAVELLLSGRLVPMSLLPGWAQRVADFLPFKWVFGFPIESVVSNLSATDLLHGLAMQLVWIGVGATGVLGVWRLAVRRHTAVGN
ncbi:ABC transporter permease [Cryptosporangium sp. NPDC051539]|uniref:ABC transporter permease n=1 Tax=Cryptosporangium sp. NPDC051539 TaxID=3363962 RepID=UPI00379FCC51